MEARPASSHDFKRASARAPEGYAPSGAHGRERRFPSHGIKRISPGTPIGEPGDTAVRAAARAAGTHAAGAHPLWRTRKLRPS